jgi:hypothetical protein
MRDLLDRVPLRRRQAHRSAVLATAAVLVASLVGFGVPGETTAFGAGTTADTPVDTTPANFRLASLNLLGAGHTAPGGNRPGWASGYTRMGWAFDLINKERLDVVGFQEMQGPQFRRFRELEGQDFGIYPGNALTTAAMANSIAWRKREWRLLQARTILIPYFDGHEIRMPYVLLRNVDTGRRAWFFNTHNPADAHGPAQRWRDKGFRIEANLVNRLRTNDPTVPVFSTGDKNDREQYFCPVVRLTELEAANGGSSEAGEGCTPPSAMRVDWVTGTEDVTFTAYEASTETIEKKITDHALIMGTVNMPSPAVARSPITRVVVLSVEGLAPRAITRYGAAGSPAIHGMMARGASTLNARTEYERTTLLPNAVGMLTGRRVDPAKQGHGVGWTGWDPSTDTTVHDAAGHYVSSVFDLVHNLGRRTAYLASNSELALVNRSWDGVNGGLDPYGEDNGRDKISRYVPTAGDGGLVTELQALLQDRPPALTVAQFRALDDAGHRYGWMHAGYRAELLATDRRIGRVLRTINASPTLAGHTLVILTSEHGGSGTDHVDKTRPGNYKVPFLVTGPGVPARGNLYAMNPAYTNPGQARAGYGGAPPIRNGFVANLATTVLGMPALPGSQFDARQDFTVFQ